MSHDDDPDMIADLILKEAHEALDAQVVTFAQNAAARISVVCDTPELVKKFGAQNLGDIVMVRPGYM